MSDLRKTLHVLAEQLGDVLARGASGTTAADSALGPASAAETPAAILAAMRALADGDLSPASIAAASHGLEHPDVRGAFERVRELVRAGREAADASARFGDARAAAERAADGASRQRVSIEKMQGQLRELSLQLAEIERDARETSETGERLALVALNAGIEGVRVGGEVARALLALGDELRKLSQRAATSAREIAVRIQAVSLQIRSLSEAADDAARAARSAGDDAQSAVRVVESARRADAGLAGVLRHFRLVDDDTQSVVAELDAAAAGAATAFARIDPARLGRDDAARDAIDAAVRRLRAIVDSQRTDRGGDGA